MADLSVGSGLVGESEASAIESIDMFCFELFRAWAPPKRRFYTSWNNLYFPEIFSQRKLGIHAIRRGDGKHFTAKLLWNFNG